MSLDKDFFTVQNVIAICALIFTFGVTYATLSTADTAQEKSIDDIKQRQAKFAVDIEEIKVKTGKIEAGQDAQSKEIGLMREDVQEVRAYMQQILRELRQ